LSSFDALLVPEMNTGQFASLIRSIFLLDAQKLNKISGQPFKIEEIEGAIRAQLESAK
jgi:2-oxoglutarate ferredoxin oxidoreductase subunit alpha